MSNSELFTSDEAEAQNAALTPETDAILLDLDWDNDEFFKDGHMTRKYTYPRKLYNNYVSFIQLMGLAVYVAIRTQPVGNYKPNIVGVIFSGGYDIPPVFYNEPVKGAIIAPTSRARFLYATEEYLWAQGRVPIMGICWGAQFMAVLAGGALVQDLKPTHRHRYKTFQMELLEGSWLQKALNKPDMTVNCNHHQGLKRIPPKYRVTAWEKEGFPHSFESVEGILELGIIAHPERLTNETDTITLATEWAKLCLEIKAQKANVTEDDIPFEVSDHATKPEGLSAKN